MSKVKAIPERLHSITPHLVVKNATQAIDFYKKGLGGQEIFCSKGPDGKVMHAEVHVGDSAIFLSDEFMGAKGPEGGMSPVTLHLYTEDADALFNRAVAAGATVRMPMMDAFWGDRYGQIVDPAGHVWAIATHKEDVSPDEMMKRAMAFQPK